MFHHPFLTIILFPQFLSITFFNQDYLLDNNNEQTTLILLSVEQPKSIFTAARWLLFFFRKIEGEWAL